MGWMQGSLMKKGAGIALGWRSDQQKVNSVHSLNDAGFYSNVFLTFFSWPSLKNVLEPKPQNDLDFSTALEK